MKSSFWLAPLIASLTFVDLWRSDLRNREMLRDSLGLELDWKTQWMTGQLAKVYQDNFSQCRTCRLGFYYRQLMEEDERKWPPPPPPLSDSLTLGEWAFSLGMAMASKNSSLDLLQLNPPPGFLFVISGYAFYHVAIKTSHEMIHACQSEFAAFEQKACFFGVGLGAALNEESIVTVRRAPYEFVAGYLEAKSPHPCPDGRHPLFCLPGR